MSGQQPISFKTVPNRNKTKKWQTARQYNYDGDDWGGYDPYDEYGEYDEAPPVPAPPSQPAMPSRLQKQNSFDRGDERRQFSGPANLSMYSNPDRGGSPARSAVSGGSGGRPSGDSQRPLPSGRPRDFTNPDEVPLPLNTRVTPAPPAMPPIPTQFPPRKASASASSGSPAPEMASAAPSAVSLTNDGGAKADKELPMIPIIRPSDIYKRMAEEKEKERISMDSTSRPSIDEIQQNLQESDSEKFSTRPLSSVQEHPNILQPATYSRSNGKTTHVMPPQDFDDLGSTAAKTPAESYTMGQSSLAPDNSSPSLPELSRFSGFGADFLGGSSITGSNPIESNVPATRAPPGADPAAEILAERQHPSTVEQVGRKPDELVHQPSQGYRSMVHQAFDQTQSRAVQQNPTSPDGSQYTTDFSRSNTTSSGNISPIISRMPSTGISQQRQADLEATVPTVAEESPQNIFSSGNLQDPASRRAGNSERSGDDSGVALAAAGVKAGYRRSLDPPTEDNSPARSPGMENAKSRRLSGPMTADTLYESNVPSQGIPESSKRETTEPASIWAGEGEVLSSKTFNAVETTTRSGRPRAGTDYSIREADIAQEVNVSDNKPEFSPEVAAQEKANQNLFLSTHAGTPTTAVNPQWRSTSPMESPGPSPAKSRVKEIADKYQEIHNASRSNSISSSKSSWSNFKGSDENLKRRGTGEAQLDGERETLEPLQSREPRPESFRPHLPGEWISFSGTPKDEKPESATLSHGNRDITPRASQMPQQSDIDLTPTTNKVQLQGTHEADATMSKSDVGGTFSQVKSAGDALGAALIAAAGIGHQTRDFGSTGPATEVTQPDNKLRYGALPDANLRPPPFQRGYTDTSTATDVTSAAGSAPPTPPVKDGPRDLVGGVSGDRGNFLGQETSGDYSMDTVAPLKTSRDRTEGPASVSGAGLSLQTEALDESRTEDLDSDQLRQEIERSLTPLDGTSVEEDRERTQDALDAPLNAARVDAGGDALPNAETRPSMLEQRFSWERITEAATVQAATTVPDIAQPTPIVREPEAEYSPEIKPEMPYERPRSRGLHIMNADSSDEEDQEGDLKLPHPAESSQPTVFTSATGSSAVSPLTASQEALSLHLSPADRRFSETRDLKDLAPSPMSESISTRLPSYYMQEHSPIGEDDTQDGFDTSNSDADPDVKVAQPAVVAIPSTVETSSPTKQKQKLPLFREILAIKAAPERIFAFDDTRHTFADMNTGLSDWLSGMLVQHPEYASLSTTPSRFNPSTVPGSSAGPGTLGHRKNSASIAVKLGKSFGGGGASSEAQRRSNSLDASDTAPRTPAKDFVGNAVDMDKMQQRGKDLMKSAGVLGGKAQVGAKGLWAKGRSRFGSKRESSGPSGKAPLSTLRSPSVAATPSAPRSLTPGPPHPNVPIGVESTPMTHLSQTDVNESHAPRPVLCPPAEGHPVNIVHVDGPPSSRSPTPQPEHAPTSLLREGKLSRNPSTAGSGHGSALSMTLSQTFSRIKNRSRSLSRHRGSRPGSVVLPNVTSPTALAMPEYEPGTEPPPLAALTGPRKEFWSEPDSMDLKLPPRTPLRGEGSERTAPWRLGVLPSPGVEMMGGYFDGSPTTSILAAMNSTTDDQQLQAPPDMSIEVPPSPTRAAPQRTGSDLAGLPSQLRRASLGDPSKLVLTPLRTSLDLEERPLGSDENIPPLPSPSMKTSAAMRDGSHIPGDFSGSEDFPPPSTVIAPSGMKMATTISPSPPTDPETGLLGREIVYQPVVSGSTPAMEEENKTKSQTGLWMPSPDSNLARSPALAGDMLRSPIEPAVSPLSDENERPPKAGDTDVSRPSSPVRHWDTRSEISAEAPADQGPAGGELSRVSSRRSSVSSMGSPTTASYVAGESKLSLARVVDSTVNEPLTPSQVPGTPGRSTPSASIQLSPPLPPKSPFRPSEIDQHEIVGIRQPQPLRSGPRYRPQQIAARPLGYAHPDPEFPSQKSVEQSTSSVDISTISGSPSIEAPFRQNLGLITGSSAGTSSAVQYDRMRSPLSADSTSMRQNQQFEGQAGDRRSKRFSGLFRSSTRPVSTVVDQHHLGQTNPYVPPSFRDPKPASGETQGRRRSGIWETLIRSPSSTKEKVDRRKSVAGGFITPDSSKRDVETSQAVPLRDSVGRGNTLKKQPIPQRTVSAVVPPEPKKKRFSGLGSIFRRSKTTAREGDMPKKLTKTQQTQKKDSQSMMLTSASTTYSYDDLETMATGQEFPEIDKQDSRGYPPIPGHRRHVSDMTDVPVPPKNSFRRIEKPQEALREPTLPRLSEPPPHQPQNPQVNRQRREILYASIPESFRPLESAYGRSASSKAMPEGYDSALQLQPSVHPEQVDSWADEQSYEHPPRPAPRRTVQDVPAQRRHSSYSSGGYSLSPTVSGRSEWQRDEWGSRGSVPSVSPLRTRQGSEAWPQDERFRVTSISEEMARRPSQDDHPQASWPLPPDRDNGAQGVDPQTWTPHHAVDRPPMGFEEDFQSSNPSSAQFADPRGVTQRVSAPSRPWNGPPIYQNPYDTPPPSTTTTQTPFYRDPLPWDTAHRQPKPYQTPPYSPESPSSQQNIPPFGPAPPGGLQRRYYARSGARRPPVQSPNDGPPGPPRRRSSGPRGPQMHPGMSPPFIGRRDDPTVAEETYDMRGVSYPGQEWTPTGIMSDEDWD